MNDETLSYDYKSISLAIIIFLLVRNFLPLLYPSFVDGENTIMTSIFLGGTLIISCMVPVFYLRSSYSFKLNFDKDNSFVKFLPLVFYGQILILLFSIVNNIFILIITNIFDFQFIIQELMPINNTLEFILQYIYIAIIPAVFEEILIRGFIMNILLKYSKFLAVFLTSFLFMLMHQSIQQLLAVFLASLVISGVYLLTKDLRACIALHLVNNSYSFIMIYINTYLQNNIGYNLALVINMIVLSFGIIGLYSLIKSKKGILSSFKYEKEDGKRLLFIFKSPVMCFAIFMCIYSIYVFFEFTVV